MSEDASGAEPAAPTVSQAQLQKAEAYVEAEEGVVNRLFGWAGRLVTSIAVAMSLFHLYAAVAGAWPFTDFPIIATQPLRYAHVAFVLMLSFLLFPLSARFRDRIRWWDIAAFAAAAITGGDPYKTTLQAWKYTLPAFLVPFVFVLDPQGIGLLLKIPKDGSWIDIVLVTAKATLGLAALAAAAQGWALRKTTLVERLLLALAGLFLVFPSLLEALMEAVIGRDIDYTATFGLAIGAAVLLRQRMTLAAPR